MKRKLIKTALALALSSVSFASFATVGVGERVTVNGEEVTQDYANALANESNQTVVVMGENVHGISVSKDSLNVFGDNISIEGTNSHRAISLAEGASLTIGGSNTENIIIKADDVNTAILAHNNTKLDITAKQLEIISEGSAGIWLQSGTEEEQRPDNNTKVSINTENTTITASEAGIRVYSNSQLDISGSLTVTAPIAIDTRGNSLININEDGKGIVVLNGDIHFESPVENSGTILNSEVNINLVGEGSSWTGGIGKFYKTGYESVSDVKQFHLTLSDGAVWNSKTANVDASPEYEDMVKIPDIKLNKLTLNNGVINVIDTHEAKIGELGGTGGAINFVATTDDGKQISSGSVTVENTLSTLPVTVSLIGMTADDITDANAAMESLNKKVSGGQLVKTQTISEGDIKGAITQTIAADGTGSAIKVSENTKLASFRGLNATALVAWRDEVAYTNQRMEFLRDNSHAYGAWAQVYGGESKYEDKAELTTTTVQVGADMAIGDWLAGAAFSYMTGEADLLRGDADTDAYTLSLYAERNFDSGLFVNGLARYGRLSTDATAGNMDASYDNNAFSLGGNVGYRFTFAEQAFVEPNFGLQYAYVMGDDYKASNGVKVEQDDFDALIASLGVRVGFNFPNNAGKLFARASVNHDFLGEIDGTASKADLAESMYMDLGGTWVTYGVGTQFNITDNLSVWGNVDRTTGGEVSTNYMMNAGLRYVF